MRFFLVFFGCIVLAILSSKAQEVAIDLSIDRLLPRTVSDSPTDQIHIYHPLFELKGNAEMQIPEQKYQFEGVEGTQDLRKQRYWKLGKIIRNAPPVRPHFLVQSQLLRGNNYGKILPEDQKMIKKIKSELKLVY